MLKIRNRIALIYSIFSVVLIIFCMITFVGILKYDIDNEPITTSITKTIYNEDSNEDIASSNGSQKGGNTEDDTYENVIEKVSGNTAGESNDKYQTMSGIKEGTMQHDDETKTQIIFIKENEAIKVEKNSIDNNVESNTKEKSDKSNEDIKVEIKELTLEKFEDILMKNLYARFAIIILISIILCILINFLLGKRYAKFALKPLLNFTEKVKEQRSSKDIKLVEVPEVKDEIYNLTLAYNDALTQFKVSYSNLNRLNSYISHELRNSLAILRAKMEIGEDKEDTIEYIDKLNVTVRDMLAMATMSLSENQEDVDLALICAKVVDDYSAIFKNITFSIPEDGVHCIKGRSVWIERCVINLIDNAIKFKDSNKEKNKISVNVYENDINVIIEVIDNGIGINKADLKKIFIPYYWTKSRTSTGFVLAYVKHIMELHKGKVFVESKQGEYSKFSLIFIR